MAPAKCPACGNDVSIHAVSCPQCGYLLQAATIPGASPPPTLDWRRLDRWLATKPLVVRVLVGGALLILLYFALVWVFSPSPAR
jgi:hypothetical protein